MEPSAPPLPAQGGVRLLAVGDNVVDCYPDLGVMYPGGNAVNVAVNAVRLGARAAYLGAVGTDRAGRVVHEALRAEGVDLAPLRVVEGRNAAAVVRVVDGNRVFVGGDVGVSAFRLDEADLAGVRGYDVVHTGECSMVEQDLPALAGAARLLSFDFSERPWDYVVEHAKFAGVAVASLPDGTLDDAVEHARRLAALGPRVAAVTTGPRGAALLRDGVVTTSPAGSGEVVDTLGAGDAFIARLLVGLARGEATPDLLAAATAYATSTCSTYGAFGHETSLDGVTLPDVPTPSRSM